MEIKQSTAMKTFSCNLVLWVQLIQNADNFDCKHLKTRSCTPTVLISIITSKEFQWHTQWTTVLCHRNGRTQSCKNITLLQASHQATGYYQFLLDPTDNILSPQRQQKVAWVIVTTAMVWPKHAVYYGACNLWDPWGLDNDEKKVDIDSFSISK